MNSNVEQSHRTKGLLRLTMACNERCPFCNVPMEDYPKLTPPKNEVDEQLRDFIASGEQTLTISGGEPTLLRKRLLDLIKGARDNDVPFVELQSNAILIDSEYAEELAQAGLTSAFISLLSDSPELHDELAGYPGAFPKCIRGIQALLDVGIRVTLNPVLAYQSQHRLVEYMHFVGRELEGVQSISLSAVQPHGRAAKNLYLLPDYQALAALVPEAIEVAKSYNIEVLNPYCGLPLCIGWTSAIERSVEAIEAKGGGWQEKPNISNQGDKSKRAPCQWCAYRSVCGGAWHAYWDQRAGKGIEPPATMIPPWIEIVNNEHQQVRSLQQVDDWNQENLDSPTIWFVLRTFSEADINKILALPCTELVLICDPTGLHRHDMNAKELVRCIRKIQSRLTPKSCRLHLLADDMRFDSLDCQSLDLLGERIGCNVKRGRIPLPQF